MPTTDARRRHPSADRSARPTPGRTRSGSRPTRLPARRTYRARSRRRRRTNRVGPPTRSNRRAEWVSRHRRRGGVRSSVVAPLERSVNRAARRRHADPRTTEGSRGTVPPTRSPRLAAGSERDEGSTRLSLRPSDRTPFVLHDDRVSRRGLVEGVRETVRAPDRLPASFAVPRVGR